MTAPGHSLMQQLLCSAAPLTTPVYAGCLLGLECCRLDSDDTRSMGTRCSAVADVAGSRAHLLARGWLRGARRPTLLAAAVNARQEHTATTCMRLGPELLAKVEQEGGSEVRGDRPYLLLPSMLDRSIRRLHACDLSQSFWPKSSKRVAPRCAETDPTCCCRQC